MVLEQSWRSHADIVLHLSPLCAERSDIAMTRKTRFYHHDGRAVDPSGRRGDHDIFAACAAHGGASSLYRGCRKPRGMVRCSMMCPRQAQRGRRGTAGI